MRDVKVYNEIAFANYDDKRDKYSLNMKLRQSMDNDKGGNGFVASTYTQQGKPYNFVRVGLDKAKSGPHAGESEFDRLAEAAEWDSDVVEEVNAHYKEWAHAETGKEHVVEPLTNASATIKGYPSGDDLKNKEKQTLYYRDYKSNLTNDTIKEGDSHKPNPEKRSAHFGNIEDTVSSYPDFDPDVNAEKVAERSEKRKVLQLADKLNNQASTDIGTPAAPVSTKEGVDISELF